MRTSELAGSDTTRATSSVSARLFNDPAQGCLALWLSLFALPWMLLTRDLPPEDDEYSWLDEAVTGP